MPSILEELDEWKLEGVPFLVRRPATTKGGRKTATYEFINSSKRVVEDLGLLQKTFQLEGIISNTDGQYFLKRNALINTLETEGTKVLSHAFFGKFIVVPRPYSLVESVANLGEAVFNMTFDRAEDRIEPLADAFTQSKIEELKQVSLNAFKENVADNYKNSPSFPFNFTVATAYLEGLANQFDEITSTFNRALSEIDNFSEQLNDFRNSILQLVNLPGQLALTLENLYASAVSLAETPAEAFLTLEKFFDFGEDLPGIIPTTFELLERLRNQELLNFFIQGSALSYAYSQVASITFFTVREIDDYLAKLEKQYNKIFPLITNRTAALSLQNLRNTANEFLNAQKINVKKIVDFSTQTIPAQVLVYSLYGSVDNYERLVQLNVIKDPSFVSGQIEVFR